MDEMGRNLAPAPHVKYPRYLSAEEEREQAEIRATPSMLAEELHGGAPGNNRRSNQIIRGPAPEIIGFVHDMEVDESSVPVDEPLFQPFPLHLEFREYEEYGLFRQTLYFRNNDSVPRRMRVEKLDSQYFKVTPNPRKNDRIAPGMELSYEVTFRPHKRKEYCEFLVCVTEREKFRIPISAPGPFACMDFPDEVHFGTCPVNHRNERTFLVRNIGEKDAHFSLSTSSPFDVKPANGFIEIGGSLQITVFFNGDHCGQYNGELEISYENGQASFAKLSGSTESVSVSVDKPVAEVDPAYISLRATTTVKIKNDADLPVHFEWRGFANEFDEEEERTRLLEDLKRLEQQENVQLEDRHDLAAVKQKYKNLRKAVQDDQMLFADENFKIEPMSGQVWSRSSKEITIAFSSQVAAKFAVIAFLLVSGRENRIPLKLLGEGLGPKAGFLSSMVDVGTVFIKTSHTFCLQLENRGDIDCEFMLDPIDPVIYDQVSFEPSSGVLAVESAKNVLVKFTSKSLGRFSEKFSFTLKGTTEKLVVKVKATVIGPTFKLNIPEFHFGRVPFGFTNAKAFKILNTSLIPMEFKLRVPGDGKFEENEFVLIPDTGVIPPKEEFDVIFEFTSRTVMHYNLELVVDVVDIGEGILKVPIVGVCAVANVSVKQCHHKFAQESANPLAAVDEDDLSSSSQQDNEEPGSALTSSLIETSRNDGDLQLDFGPCFLRHPETRSLLLRNTSDVSARFFVSEQDDSTLSRGTFSCKMNEGVIEPMSEVPLEVTLLVQRRGRISLPLFVRIEGSDKPPMMVDLLCKGCGPCLVISPNEIDFGTIRCLDVVKQEFEIFNKSLIPAPFHVSLAKGQQSRFSVEKVNGELNPGETMQFSVAVSADDTITFHDDLKICVEDGEPLHLAVHAQGSGTTLFCSNHPELELCDFGTLFTAKNHEKKYLVENRGQRTQVLAWSNLSLQARIQDRKKKVLERDKLLKDKDKEAQKRAKRVIVPPEPEPSFEIYPDSVQLKPQMGCMFTVRAYATVPDENHVESFILESKVGKAKKPTKIWSSKICASFINPLLESSLDVIEFNYTFHPDDEHSFFNLNGSSRPPGADLVQKVPLKLKNVAKLPLNFILKTKDPFSVDTWEISMQSGEETTVTVKFDPLVGDEPVSRVTEGALLISHQNHPQKDSIEIQAKVYFPNLDFDTDAVNFGCLLNDTTKTKKLVITNNSVIEARFNWAFLERSSSSKNVNPNESFDIKPIRGSLGPDQSIEAEISFFALPERKVEVTAICDVDGGPDYEIKLLGEAANISFELDKDQIEFGNVLFNGNAETDLVISNTGKVAFDFRTIFDSSQDNLEVLPSEGKINPKSSLKLTVRFLPKLPQMMELDFGISVAHLESKIVKIKGVGIFANLVMNLPRVDIELSDVEQESGRAGVRRHQQKFDPKWVLSEVEANRMKFLKFLRVKENEAPACWDTFDVATYGIDFSYTIVGKSRKKSVRILNSSEVPLTFEVDKAAVAGTCFSVENGSIQKLGPGEHVDIDVRASVKRDAVLGLERVSIPIRVVDGPSVRIAASIYITMPEVILSQSSYSFGTILLGSVKVMALQLKNTSPVQADWSIQGEGFSKGDIFKCVPASGSLQPSRRVNVEIFFAPVQAQIYQVSFNVRVMDNTTWKVIKCKGIAEAIQLECTSELLEMDPTLPSDASTAYREFEIFNKSPFAVEVFSVDFDETYRKEEDMISAILSSNGKEFLEADLRQCGESLQQSIVTKYKELVPEDEYGVGEIEDPRMVYSEPQPPTYRDRGLALDVLILIHDVAGWNGGEFLNRVQDRLGENVPQVSIDKVLELAAEEGIISSAKKNTKRVVDDVELSFQHFLGKQETRNGCLISGLHSEVLGDDAAQEKVLNALLRAFSSEGMNQASKLRVIGSEGLPMDQNNLLVLSQDELEDMEKCISRVDEFLPEPGTPKPPDWDEFYIPVPNPRQYQILMKPKKRPKRSPALQWFDIEMSSANEDNEIEENEIAPEEKSYRWIVAEGSSLRLKLLFNASEVGTFEQQFVFEAVGSSRQHWVISKAICSYPAISTDPRTVFMNRIKTQPSRGLISKKYVQAKESFEFGPLLLGKTENNKTKAINCETLQISNSGLLPVEELVLSIGVEGGENPFSIEPNHLQLAVGESQAVNLWALPQSLGEFKGTLVATIKDNPEAVRFKTSCLGAKPELILKGPWEASDSKIAFGRSLLGTREEQRFTIQNIGPVPAQWELDAKEVAAIEELSIFPLEGELVPGESVPVFVNFHSQKEAAYEKSVTIVSMDVEECNLQETFKMGIQAEGYAITAQPDFGNELDRIDFGVLRVFTSGTRTFEVRNKGKYKVELKMIFRKKALRDLIKLEPMSGVLEPGQEEQFSISFHSVSEEHLVNNKDLQCLISEPLTGEIVESFDIPINARSAFSRFTIQPSKGMHFGAVKFDSKPEKSFEIRNEGDFDFSFEIIEASELMRRKKEDGLFWEQEVNGKRKLQEKNAVPDPKLKDLQQPASFGCFQISPSGGTVPAGDTLTVQAVFNAEGDTIAKEDVAIIINGRKPTVESEGVLEGVSFELVGESHVPGINTENFESIFEEHCVMRAFNQSANESFAFSIEERVFKFGAVVHTSVPAAGLCARFKICNPNKVKAHVKFALEPRNKKSQEDIFSLQPASLDLSPHEYEFVSVYFRPSEIYKYATKFKAEVFDGEKRPSTALLEFDIHGEGTLPCVTVVEPSTLSNDASFVLDIGRVRLGSEKKKYITVRNDGIVSATLRFDVELQEAFSFPLRGASVALAPHESRTVSVGFFPHQEGRFENEIILRVLNNEFELSRVKVVGEGFQDPVVFENLPEDNCSLDFGEIHLEKDEARRTQSFLLRSTSNDPIRFEWKVDQQLAPLLAMKPKLGHIGPFGTIEVEAELIATKEISIGDAMTKLEIQPIEYIEEAFERFGNRSIEFVDGDVSDEPAFECLGTAKTLELPCRAEVGVVKYEFPDKLSPEGLHFRATMMFQARTYKLGVRNIGKTRIDVIWTVVNNSKQGNTHVPFSIIPEESRIEAGDDEVFTVRFAPLEVENFDFFANFRVKDCADPPTKIHLSGIATRPICHFEMEPSTYLERRGALMSEPLPNCVAADLKVLEFQSLGVRIKNTGKFHVINPTSIAHEFMLTCLDEEPNVRFKCSTNQGVIAPGKRCELSFSFTAADESRQESLWEFMIKKHGLVQQILLVGEVLEPNVVLDKKHINFHSVLVGGHAEETVILENNEALPFGFHILSSSLKDMEVDKEANTTTGEGTSDLLQVEPMRGSVAPFSTQPLVVRFAPALEKRHNFNVVCVIERKPDRLNLNIKGDGNAVHEKLVLEASEHNTSAELTHGTRNLNTIDFGAIHVNEVVRRTISIHNQGKFAFDYVWVPPAELQDLHRANLALEPLRGTVKAGESLRCEITFSAEAEVEIDSLLFECTVAGARKYLLAVSGRGMKPSLQFSTFRIDFGPCFVSDANLGTKVTEERQITISNKEKDAAVSIDCLFENEDLQVTFPPCVLQPGENATAVVRFSPEELRSYDGVVPFEINGLYVVNVVFSGQGTALKLELDDADDQVIQFGGLRVGNSMTKAFTLVNRSKKSISFSLADEEDYGVGRLQRNMVTISPGVGENILLRPKERFVVKLTFAPDKRLSNFAEAVLLELNGGRRRIVLVKGASISVDAKISASSILFGNVCESCTLSRKIQVENAGDIGTSFRWELATSETKANFTVHPLEGLLHAHSQVMVEVKFHPQYIAEEIVGSAKFFSEGNDPEMIPLHLAGACISQPEDGIQELRFETKVRETVTVNAVEIKNPSKNQWILQPIVQNEYWKVADRIIVPAEGKSSFEISYRPLSMTAGNSEHNGSVFFALPDGSSLLYRLVGRATPPDAEDTVEIAVPAKKQESVPLKVQNWANNGQRLFVSIEKLDGPGDHFFIGPETIDLPAGSARDFKINFRGFREGSSSAKVTFVNKVTEEYLFYIVRAKVDTPECQGEIQLRAVVRQTASATIAIENPFFSDPAAPAVKFEPENEAEKFELSRPVCSWWTCEKTNVRVKQLRRMDASPQGAFEIQFRPLVSNFEAELATLVLKSPQLGDYPYRLILKADEAQNEKALHFRTTLGSVHSQVFRFTNFCPTSTEFKCSADQPIFFRVNPSVKAEGSKFWAGSEVAVEVKFEPQGLGEVKDVLRVESPDGGVYLCALYGTCDPPRPQGPYVVTDDAKGISIEYRNVFDNVRNFRFVTDSPNFTMNGNRAQQIKLDAHKSTSVTIKSNATNGATGKLLVTCVEEPNLPPWTFYIVKKTFT